MRSALFSDGTDAGYTAGEPNKSYPGVDSAQAYCADCDNDNGQAPSSSYHNGEGYCMQSTGNAPGWHMCVSKTGGPGGHWLYLPQLNDQHNCHPAPKRQPGRPARYQSRARQ